MLSTRWIPTLLAVLLLGACAGDDQQTSTVTRDAVQDARVALDPALVAQLDSGNAAIRGGEHGLAVTHYRRAVDIDPTSAAAWFGIYMGELALGNDEAAADALEQARSLAPRASLLDDTEPDSAPSP